ncbi:potassium channel family protein, partial [Shewanella insulae]|uniref:ion channel n=1 Tax=Shewanella insulae TaxID=2681496 RepID=UPI001EFE3B7D
AYTFASVASPSGGFISGLHPILETGKTYQDASLLAVYYQIPYLFLDSIYYSVMVMTTLGDGSIQPNNIMKMVVISHVGFTFYITVFGVAEYFSSQSSKEFKSELDNLKHELLNVKQDKYAPLIKEENGEKVVSISKRFYISFKGLLTGRYV